MKIFDKILLACLIVSATFLFFYFDKTPKTLGSKDVTYLVLGVNENTPLTIELIKEGESKFYSFYNNVSSDTNISLALNSCYQDIEICNAFGVPISYVLSKESTSENVGVLENKINLLVEHKYAPFFPVNYKIHGLGSGIIFFKNINKV